MTSAGAGRPRAAAPRVSVIIPLFNGERFLAEALQSVLTQTSPPFEVIVVDDGSDDAGPDIARAHRDVQLVTQANAGNAVARNVGIARARGELLAFLDQDDVWTPEKLEVQVRRMTSDPDLDYTVAHHRLFLDAGCPRPPWLRAELLDRAVPGFVPGTLLARASLFDRVGLFDSRYLGGSDLDWFVRCRDAKIPMAVLDDVLLFRRIHDRNLSADARSASDVVLSVHAALVRRRAGPGATPRP
jgi:glycosyltransferase involved in cell wall biosynthesis